MDMLKDNGYDNFRVLQEAENARLGPNPPSRSSKGAISRDIYSYCAIATSAINKAISVILNLPCMKAKCMRYQAF